MALFNSLNSSEQLALYTLADALRVPASWIDQLIAFESSWNPQAVNKLTGASGLIQFMPATARSLGYKDSTDLLKQAPDRLSQLTKPVYQYLRQFAPYPTEQSLYMAVFYPKARSWSVSQEFPLEVQRVNPGIKTVSDYMRKVGIAKAINVIKPFTLIAAVIACIVILNHFQKDGNLWQEENTGQEETL